MKWCSLLYRSRDYSLSTALVVCVSSPVWYVKMSCDLYTHLYCDTRLEPLIFISSDFHHLQQNKYRYILVNHSGHTLSNSSMKVILWSPILFSFFSLYLNAPLLHSMKLDYVRLSCLACQRVFQKCYSNMVLSFQKVLVLWILPESPRDPAETKPPRFESATCSWTRHFLLGPYLFLK